MRNPIIVGLDVDDLATARKLVAELRDVVGGFKIGLQLCNRVGTPQAIEVLSAEGGALFVDLKFKDIPNTVAAAVRAVALPGVAMLNVHCDGGLRMMQAAHDALPDASHRPLLLGVTVLTSFDNRMLNDETRVSGDIDQQATHLARLAQTAHLDGVVCSAFELEAIRAACGREMVTVVPGIRPDWAGADDQRRYMTPAEAIRAGANYIVVARPITRPSTGTPAQAAQRIADEIATVRSA